jgi:hypothetical protein
MELIMGRPSGDVKHKTGAPECAVSLIGARKTPARHVIDTGGGEGYDSNADMHLEVPCHEGAIMLSPAIIEELQRIVGPDNLLTAAEEKLVYECDGLTMFKAMPEVVVFPTSTPQLAEVVRLADDPHDGPRLRSGELRFRLAQPVSGAVAPAPAPAPTEHRVEKGPVTERHVRDAEAAGVRRLVLGPAAVLTPMARDRARGAGVEVVRESRQNGRQS